MLGRWHWGVGFVALFSFLLLGPTLGRAANQPIYPAYDGFLKNPDGSYTLAFAYFSHNAEVVTIPPAPTTPSRRGPAIGSSPRCSSPGTGGFSA